MVSSVAGMLCTTYIGVLQRYGVYRVQRDRKLKGTDVRSR